MTEIRVYNSLHRQLDTFTPLTAGQVGLYTCGPTVYNFAHIGNFRAYVFEDLLRRFLLFRGYKVTQVMNLTDVDDKTIRGAREQKQTLHAYTKPFKDAFFDDLKTLRIDPAEHYPAATDHIPEMIELIKTLIQRGVAYATEDGSVYFSIKHYPAYGKLVHLDPAAARTSARVASDEYEKEDIADFALWKAWDPQDGEVAWDSPWGRGRPGWHIECSAMSMKYLGETFDIHTGGIDNMFPHHEDEIAQSEAATGKPFVNYWLHCAHLVVDGHKMSKSLGNFYTLRDLIARGFSGREIRYVLLSAHYRQSLNFTFDALKSARTSLQRLDEFLERVEQHPANGTGPAPWATDGVQAFLGALAQDLNMPEALAALFTMMHAGHRAMDAGDVGWDSSRTLETVKSLDRILALAPDQQAATAPAAVEALLQQRGTARKNKNWAEADRIRDELAAMGWEVRDTPDGQKLKRMQLAL